MALVALAGLVFMTQISCSSSLLSQTPATIEVSVEDPPTATTTYNSASLAFTTDSTVTVSVEYGTVSGSYPVSVPRSANASSTHVVALTGLSSATVYYYKVVSYLGTARSFKSDEYSFTTGVPGTVAVSGTPVSVPTYESATITFNTTVASTFILEYGTVSGTYTKATPRSSTQVTAQSVSLVGLSPSTTYYYRIGLYLDDVFVVNSIEYSVITAAHPSAALSVNVEPVSTPAFDSATVYFETSIDATYTVEYGIASSTYTKVIPRTSTATKFHTVSFTGLSPSTTYYYRMGLYLDGVYVSPSAEYSFTTLAHPLVISKEPVSTPTYNSCSIYFETAVPATYTVEYGTVTGIYTKGLTQSSTVNSGHTATLANLLPSIPYYYRIGLYRNGSFVKYTGQYSFTTTADPNVLSITSGPTVSYPSYTSLTISWGTNLGCTHFIEYGTLSSTPGNYPNSTVATSSVATEHTVTLAGLASGTVYYYRIHLLWDGGTDYVSPIELTATTSSETAPTMAQKTRGIWILGGIPATAATSPIAEVDLYDPVLGVDGTWYPAVTSIPIPVSFAAYAAYNGELFVIGGFDSSGAPKVNVQIYTIATNTWRVGSNTNFTARANIYASVLYGRIYVTGGTSGLNNGTYAAVGNSFEYDITAGAGAGVWTTKVPPTTAGSEKFTVAFDNVNYQLGGRTTVTAVSTAVDGAVYSTNTLTTVIEPVLGVARTGIAGAVNKPATGAASIIVIGGITTITNNTNCFINDGAALQPTGAANGTVVYLPYPFVAPAIWIAGPALGVNSAFGAAVITSVTGSARLYHFGGTPALGASGVAFGTTTVRWIPPPVVPNAWVDTWTTVAAQPMPVARPRWGHGAVTLSN